MTVCAAVLAPSGRPAPPGLREAVAAALASGAEETLAVVGVAAAAAVVPEAATVLLDDAAAPDEASAARVAVDWAARAGHAAVVVAFGDLRRVAAASAEAWTALVQVPAKDPVVVGTRRGEPAGLARLEAASWSLLPLSGPLAVLWRAHPELASKLELAGAGR